MIGLRDGYCLSASPAVQSTDTAIIDRRPSTIARLKSPCRIDPHKLSTYRAFAHIG